VSRERPTLDELVDGVRGGDRRLLAQAITLVESTRADDAADARELIRQVLPGAGRAVRLGITGAPGVGKSTFIESFGAQLTSKGLKLAVLAVDPSSAVSGGSILGDKTRMNRLSRDENAFIRPSPGAGTLGGVARRTREAMLVCEAAGYDVVFVETIGVGQSETAVANMVDFFLLLVLPGGGDELQGIKKGITELADAIVVTKADGDNVGRARIAQAEYAAALRILHAGDDTPPVMSCSAVSGEGLSEIWDHVTARRAAMEADGRLAQKRRHQALRWMEDTLEDLLRERFVRHPAVAAALPDIREDVLSGSLDPHEAAVRLLDLSAERS